MPKKEQSDDGMGFSEKSDKLNGDALILSMDYQETGEILTVLIGEEKRRKERERERGGKMKDSRS